VYFDLRSEVSKAVSCPSGVNGSFFEVSPFKIFLLSRTTWSSRSLFVVGRINCFYTFPHIKNMVAGDKLDLPKFSFFLEFS